MVAAPVLWSTAGVVTRHIHGAAAFEQVFWRSIFAFAFVLLVLRKNPYKAVRATGWPGLFSGAMWTVMFTAFVIALSLTTTANTLVVVSLGPLLTALLALFFLKEKIQPGTWIAVACASAGIAWMFHDGFQAGRVAGILVALLVPIAAAANVVTLRASAARVDLIPAVMLGGFLSCLIALPLALPFQGSVKDILLLAFLGIFQLGLPCVLLVIASRTLAATEIALLSLLEVVLGPIWAWLGAGEVPGQATLVGGAVVLLALAGNELSAFRRKPV